MYCRKCGGKHDTAVCDAGEPAKPGLGEIYHGKVIRVGTMQVANEMLTGCFVEVSRDQLMQEHLPLYEIVSICQPHTTPVAPAKKCNDWCKGMEVAPGEYSGCSCDCPGCKASAEAVSMLNERLVERTRAYEAKDAGQVRLILRLQEDIRRLQELVDNKVDAANGMRVELNSLRSRLEERGDHHG